MSPGPDREGANRVRVSGIVVGPIFVDESRDNRCVVSFGIETRDNCPTVTPGMPAARFPVLTGDDLRILPGVLDEGDQVLVEGHPHAWLGGESDATVRPITGIKADRVEFGLPATKDGVRG